MCVDRFDKVDDCMERKFNFCNESFAPGEKMHVCYDKGPKFCDDRFVCVRIPNCPPFFHRRRCCFC